MPFLAKSGDKATKFRYDVANVEKMGEILCPLLGKKQPPPPHVNSSERNEVTSVGGGEKLVVPSCSQIFLSFQDPLTLSRALK